MPLRTRWPQGHKERIKGSPQKPSVRAWDYGVGWWRPQDCSALLHSKQQHQLTVTISKGTKYKPQLGD